MSYRVWTISLFKANYRLKPPLWSNMENLFEQEVCYNFINVVEATNQNQLLVCGTNSFTPLCTKYQMALEGRKVILTDLGRKISGKHRCPYGPNQPSSSIFSGGSLYSATFQTFSGGSPVISRTMGQSPPLSTSDLINEPSFVRMLDDDQRILFFFNEISELSGGERRSIAQVGQVCKNDVGGKRVLQKTWTTFLKSRLNCSYNGFYLDQIRDVTHPIVTNGRSIVYASFATSQNSLAGSAICSFTLDAVHSSMTGAFQASHDVTSSSSNVGKIPPASSRHPGLCPDEKATDSELLFINSHPQMDKQVEGVLQLTNQGSRWNALAVDPAAGSNNVTMLFIGTEQGYLIRALAPDTRWQKGAILREQNVFDEKRCSRSGEKDERKIIQIILETDSVVVAFPHCVVSVPLSSCAIHRCRSACIGAADPYCGWSGRDCVSYQPGLKFEQNLASALASTPLVRCPDPPSVDEEDTTAQPPTEPISESKRGTSVVIPEPAEVGEEMYSKNHLITVAVVTFTATFVICLSFYLIWKKCCCDRLTRDEVDEFEKKQMEEHRLAISPDDKSASLTRKAQRWVNIFRRNVTPSTTPQITPKNKFVPESRRRRENDYSEAPTLQHRAENARAMRKSSSRLNSTSSVTTSRHDAISDVTPTQPLLASPSNDFYFSDSTLPKHVADAATLRLSPKHPSGSLSSSGGSPSPVYQDGAAETGTFPTASAKLRRRNERVMTQTNEIMRDSDTAIRDFESALLQMEKHGIGVYPPTHSLSGVARQRLDSNDSGKGESPRNSLRTDLEQPVSVYTSRAPRPTSLNLQRCVTQKRQRLLSEPSMGHEVISLQRHHPMRTPSLSSRSQPTTPNSTPQKLSLYQEPSQEVSLYGTLPKQIPGSGRMKGFQPYQPISVREAEEQRRTMARSSIGNGPPNLYPSLQVRGPYAHKMHYPPQQGWSTPPKNHYPSLPHKSSSAPFGQATSNNSYVTGAGFERPATLHRREKLPSVMRQTSMPGTARPGMFVPPPIVPDPV
ncbi:uncharacterized protein LOC143456673 isoform X2 [Clavelina lepadiformis]|uniref:uncharacterized protein LOC143456673 isoform X2 n=1 Tax=Clavelina lepadiformis TaxID=159417 RepID=UPI004041A82E